MAAASLTRRGIGSSGIPSVVQAGLGERRELSRRGDTRRTGFLSLKKRDLVRFITLKKRKIFKLKFDNNYGRDHQKRLIEAKIEDPKVSRIDKPM